MSVFHSKFAVCGLIQIDDFWCCLFLHNFQICVFGPGFSPELRLNEVTCLKEFLAKMPHWCLRLNCVSLCTLQLLPLAPPPPANSPPSNLPLLGYVLCVWHYCLAIFSVHKPRSYTRLLLLDHSRLSVCHQVLSFLTPFPTLLPTALVQAPELSYTCINAVVL